MQDFNTTLSSDGSIYPLPGRMKSVFSLNIAAVSTRTVYVIDFEQESKLVHLRSASQQTQATHELLQTDGTTVIFVKQLKEALSKERL